MKPDCGSACPDCDGEGVINGWYDIELSCDHCLGTGLDPDDFDVKRFALAERELQKKCRATWLLYEGGAYRGRTGGRHGELRYADFKLKEVADEN